VDDAVTRHFFNGFMRLHVLYHAAKDAVYGAEIADELRRHGYWVSQGTLYPMLHQLERSGYLVSRMQFVAGRRRRYYRATASGHRVLASSRTRLRELVAEILQDRDTEFQAIRNRHR
jgi:DNA-binding PadR family transcriptional regulator